VKESRQYKWNEVEAGISCPPRPDGVVMGGIR
jgi:hypothetical protein